MEENTTNQASKPASSTGVVDLYKNAWVVIKANLKNFILITLVGIAVGLVLTIVVQKFLLNNLSGDIGEFFSGALLTATISIIAGTYTGLLQVVAYKKAIAKQPTDVGVVLSDSWKYVPRSLGYGAFVIAVVIGAAILLGVIGALAGPLALLGGLIAIALSVIALFRYAFVQYLIVEDKQLGFMERFTISQKLTNGYYAKIFLTALMGIVIAIGFSIVTTALARPFKPDPVSLSEISITESDDFDSVLNKVQDGVEEETDANFIIRNFIQEVGSWSSGLFILGAFYGLYTARVKDTNTDLRS